VRSMTILAVGAVVAAPVAGHHSDAAVDIQSVVTIEGTITEYSWRNPHIYFALEVEGEADEPVEWTVQMAGTISVARMGWTPDTLSAGERVAVDVHPARDGRPYGLFDSIEKEGLALPTSFDNDTGELRFVAPEATGSATTLEGRWMADGFEVASYVDGYAGFTRTHLKLTEKAAAAQATYDEFSDDNPELSCLGRPTPAMIFYSDLFPMEIEFNEEEETIYIRGQFFDEERTVYMDGRSHPEGGERIHEGHSIGWWEGNTLVIDTRNFTANRSPYQNGIPSGAQKHVVERYRRSEDGTRIFVEFMLEDPENILEPLTHSRELLYRPDADMSPFNCDLDSTRRFVPQ